MKTSNNPLFSVCIPFYQNEYYLLLAIESVLEQSNKDYELIISLDSELSEATLINIKQRAPGARIFKNPKIGIAHNWNNCIQHARGIYTVILHADDQLLPNFLATQLKLMEYSTASASFCNVQLIDGEGQPTRSLADSIKPCLEPQGNPFTVEGDSGLGSLIRGCYIYCPTLCYRSNIIKKYGFDPNWNMVLDLELYYRLLRDGHQLIGTKKRAYNYRRHGLNQTAVLTENLSRFQEEWALYNVVANELDPISWPITIRQARYKIMLRLHLLYDSLKCALKGRVSSFRQRFLLLFSA